MEGHHGLGWITNTTPETEGRKLRQGGSAHCTLPEMPSAVCTSDGESPRLMQLARARRIRCLLHIVYASPAIGAVGPPTGELDLVEACDRPCSRCWHQAEKSGKPPLCSQFFLLLWPWPPA